MMMKKSIEHYLSPKQKQFLYDMKAVNKFHLLPKEIKEEMIKNGKVKSLSFFRKQRNKRLIAGRGFGKTRLIQYLIFNMFNTLPKTFGSFASVSLTTIQNNIFPEIKFGLKRMNVLEDYHYVIGKKPPKHFWKAEYEPDDYRKIVTFVNGFSFEFVTDRSSDDLNRGATRAFLIADELSFIDPAWYGEVLLPTVRADIFTPLAKNPLYNSVHSFTSPPKLLKGNWVFEQEELARQKPKQYFFMTGTTYDNIAILGAEFIERLKDELTPQAFNIEVLGKRMAKPANPFYQSYEEEKNTYEAYGYQYRQGVLIEGQTDYNDNDVLHISFDFNQGITSICVVQEKKDHWAVIRSMWVKFESIEALLTKFDNTYQHHKKKFVYVYGDRTGFAKEGKEFSDYERIKNFLNQKGWFVEIRAFQANIAHKTKHTICNDYFGGYGKKMVMINQQTANDLIISITNSKVIAGFQKDKSDETNPSVEQQYATHLSDALDYFIVQMDLLSSASTGGAVRMTG